MSCISFLMLKVSLLHTLPISFIMGNISSFLTNLIFQYIIFQAKKEVVLKYAEKGPEEVFN